MNRIVLLLFCSLPFVFPALGAQGSDEQAMEMIHRVNPSYTPWFQSLFEPKNESLMFAIQTLFGLLIFGLAVYGFWKRGKRQKDVD